MRYCNFCVAGFCRNHRETQVKPGDTWTYQTTIEQTANQMTQNSSQWTEKHSEITVIRAGSSSILVSNKERGSKLPPVEKMAGSDWSLYRSINGEETVVNQPLNFPLEQGKSWKLKFIENRPNNQLKYLENQLNYTIVGWEEVTVPAGKFKALKIEADGKWKSELEPSNNTSTSSRTNKEGTTVILQAKNERPKISSGRLTARIGMCRKQKYTSKPLKRTSFRTGHFPEEIRRSWNLSRLPSTGRI